MTAALLRPSPAIRGTLFVDPRSMIFTLEAELVI
jgi:hypothetical protein